MKQLHNNLLNTTIQGIKDLKNCTLGQKLKYGYNDDYGSSARNEWVINTQGTALSDVYRVPGVDFKSTTSNDLIDTIKTLGIEAVRKTLIDELKCFRSFDGIYINYRHDSLLADVMTHRGHLASLTKDSINRTPVGPLMGSTIEEPAEVFFSASTFAVQDRLKGVSDNLILGKKPLIGTGIFKILKKKVTK